jgi:methionyl-tRNA formyltransferase
VAPGLTVVFAGTPEFSVPAFEAIAASRHRLAAVYTQPDRRSGRGLKLEGSPIKQAAAARGRPIEQPASLKDPAAIARLAAYRPDVMVVVAYGLLLPQAVLDVPRLGCVNIHASLLPRWRGAAPIQRALLAGDSQTGVTIMRMEAGLDTGPMLSSEAIPIGPADTGGSLHDRLAVLGARMIVTALDSLESGTAAFEPQEDAGATYARKLSKAEASLDWTQSAELLERQVRAFDPWPVAETRLDGQQLRIWRAHTAQGVDPAPPGTVISADEAGIAVMTGKGVLVIDRLQLPGKRIMEAAEFLRGHALRRGQAFGNQELNGCG